jgi:dihydroorotase
MIVISGASVLTPDGLQIADVAIGDGRVVRVGENLSMSGARVIEATGLVLGPGFVDLHVHFRDPGETWKEDFESGASAAIVGGFTAVVAMPNTKPTIDSVGALRLAMEGAASVPIAVELAGSLTMGLRGEEMAAYDDLYGMGVRMFTDDGKTVSDAGLLRRSMAYLSDLDGVVLAQHAEDPDIAGGGHMNEGEISRRLGIRGLPASAEEVVIARDVILAAETGVAYHVQHVSTTGAVEILRRARAEGVAVTAEVTPHHLALTDSDVGQMDTNQKMYPPLRSESDRAALIAALVDGTIDAVATDHAPHTSAEKDVPFEEAPRGVIGLETAFPVVLAAMGGDIGLTFERMSTGPAEIIGLSEQGRLVEPGSPANLVLVDPDSAWTPDRFRSRSSNSPFMGRKMTGKVMATISNGNLVYQGEVDE